MAYSHLVLLFHDVTATGQLHAVLYCVFKFVNKVVKLIQKVKEKMSFLLAEEELPYNFYLNATH